MAKKMSRGLAALSSAAILSVYGAGYVLSQPAAVTMAAGTSGDAGMASSPSASPALTNPTAAAVAAPSSSAAVALKDGTYTGTGTSRHGSVSVRVTVQNGRITAAPITSVTTRYSQNVIAVLPAEVVSAQNASIQMVSGATDSSSAYVQAVQQALTKAGGSSAGVVQVTGPQGAIYSSGGGRNG